MTNGKYIVFEGMDGAGKSTAIKRVNEWLQSIYKEGEVVFTKEAGGTPIGKKIRDIILYNTAANQLTDILLFLADRNENKHRVVLPNVQKGNIVICDRSYCSSLVYQGLMNDKFKEVYDLHKKCDLLLEPDLLLIFDIDPTISMARTSKGDKFEMHDVEYFTQIRSHYKNTIPKYMSDKCRVVFIDGSQTEDMVFYNVKSIISDMLSLEKF